MDCLEYGTAGRRSKLIQRIVARRQYGFYWSVKYCRNFDSITHTLLGHRMGRNLMVEQFLSAC